MGLTSYVFEIRVVADHNWNFAVQLIRLATNHEVKQAVIHFADKHSYALRLI